MKISLKRAVQGSILILAFVMLLCLWPIKMIRPWQYIGTANPDSQAIEYNEGMVMQQFIPVNDYLRSLGLYLYNEDVKNQESATMYVRFFDANLNKLDEKKFDLQKETIPGICTIPLRGTWKEGEVYYFTIESPDTELLMSREDGVNLDVLYGYRALCSRNQYLLYGLIILAGAAVLVGLTELIFRKNKKQVYVDFAPRMAAGILAIVAGLWAAIQVFPLQRFTDKPLDIIVYELGIVLFVFFTLLALWGKKEREERLQFRMKDIWRQVSMFLQALCFTGVMLGCVRYLNALSVYDQSTALNITLLCFGLAIICDFKKKELINWNNGIYLALTIGYAVYCIEEFIGDAQEMEVYVGRMLWMGIWGLVALNVIEALADKVFKRRRLSIVYGLMILVLWILFVVNRFTKVWPLQLLVLFGLFALRLVLKGGRDRYLTSFVRGVFIHFVGISIYAVLYRVFHFYMLVRYAGVFHTPTAASVYYGFVYVIALSVFLLRYAKERSLKTCKVELCMMALSNGYLFLVSSRTGLYAMCIVAALLFVVTIFTEYRDGFLRMMKRLGIILLSAVCGLLVTFTASRLVPAIVSKPMYYEIELFWDSIKEGEEWDSYRYVTVERFLAVWDSKFSFLVEDDINKHQEENAGSFGADSSHEVGNPYAMEGLEVDKNYTSGRNVIFKEYWDLLDWEGHKDVGIDLPNGKKAVHAHNAFLQTAYDFGIGTGIYFIIFCLIAGIRTIIYYKNCGKNVYGAVPVAVMGIFAVCGMVEWVVIPYIPTGFAFFFMAALMVPSLKEDYGEENF